MREGDPAFDGPDTEPEDVTILQRFFGRALRVYDNIEDPRRFKALDASLPLTRAGDAHGVSVDLDQYAAFFRETTGQAVVWNSTPRRLRDDKFQFLSVEDGHIDEPVDGVGAALAATAVPAAENEKEAAWSAAYARVSQVIVPPPPVATTAAATAALVAMPNLIIARCLLYLEPQNLGRVASACWTLRMHAEDGGLRAARSARRAKGVDVAAALRAGFGRAALDFVARAGGLGLDAAAVEECVRVVHLTLERTLGAVLRRAVGPRARADGSVTVVASDVIAGLGKLGRPLYGYDTVTAGLWCAQQHAVLQQVHPDTTAMSTAALAVLGDLRCGCATAIQ